MDLEDTAEEAAFRAEVRSFLEQNAERRRPGSPGYEKRSQADKLAAARAWQAKKADAGFAGITFPKSAGGRGGKPIHEVLYRQEEIHYLVPRGIYEVGMSVCLPALVDCGSEEQIRRHVPPALRGEEIWCQLFSEPGAGSDLAGLRTRAVRDGGDWIVDGQKTWTSGAHYSDYGLLIARTDPGVAKHQGLSAFVVDMRAKGIQVRPFRQSFEGVYAGINDVFFDGVRLSDAQRVGAPGKGWKVAMTTLAHERYGLSESPALHAGAGDLVRLVRGLKDAKGVPLIRNAAVREKLANLSVRARGLKYTGYRTITALSQGRPLGPESTFVKLANASLTQEIGNIGVDLLGMHGLILDEDIAPVKAWFQSTMGTSATSRIAGGTDEVIRNIIAERILGLPEDVRLDKGIAFNQIRTGAR